ncbi:hypothetical protein GCM10009691_23950 [Brevibacterium picturae]|uniref:Uncharacterized protein n=1 Tax=Brevibacterium picturae TaxID=260553 RepID=A0ABN2BW95_9MICO
MLAPSSLMRDFLGMDNDGRVPSLWTIEAVITFTHGPRGDPGRDGPTGRAATVG